MNIYRLIFLILMTGPFFILAIWCVCDMIKLARMKKKWLEEKNKIRNFSGLKVVK